jgi:hypothetical protein
MTSLRSSTLALRDEEAFSPRLDPIGMREVLDADLSGYFDTIPRWVCTPASGVEKGRVGLTMRGYF